MCQRINNYLLEKRIKLDENVTLNVTLTVTLNVSENVSENVSINYDDVDRAKFLEL